MTTSLSREQAVELINRLDQRFASSADELNALDAAVGDGDHGTTIHRGMTAAAQAVNTANAETAGEVFAVAGDAFQRSSGGAGGLLFAQIFKSIGLATGVSDISISAVGEGLAKAVEQISRFGRSNPGDKTMLDALAPAAEAFDGDQTEAALLSAVRAAEDGSAATKEMAATQGRARYVADGGRGHVDPGARSVAIILKTLADVWTSSETGDGSQAKADL
ncbi:MAG: dihydroxyacetone kinase subunit DhaL [Pseudomonadota bacterium]